MNDSSKILTLNEAYDSMVVFLEKHYHMTRSADIGALLSVMQLLADDTTAAPAIPDDWKSAVEEVLNKGSGQRPYLTFK